MKKISIIIALIFLFSLYVQGAQAAKVLPQSKAGKKSVTVKKSGGSLSVSPKLRRDRKALLVYFGNLQSAKSVSYMLTYQTNGQQEGAGGSVNPTQGNTSNRELLFGTCSKNVCRYHSNITNMKLEVTAQLKSGKNLTKRFKIKI